MDNVYRAPLNYAYILAGSLVGEEEGEEDEDQEDYSGVVQGTTESLLNKLEETLAGSAEKETLQECEPGDLEEEGKDIDQVLGIISNSIYR